MRRYRNKAVRLIAGMLSVMLLAPAYPAEMSQVNAAKKSVVVTDGGAVTWDFKDESAAIYEADDASGMKVDGSLSISGRFEWHDVTHGAVLSNGTTLSVKVPAGETTIRIGVCVHTNSALTVQLTDRNATAEEVSLPLQAEQEGEEQILRYRSTQDTVVDIRIRGTGSGYMHHLTAETATLQEVTTVSGNVFADNRVSVDGQKLLFEDEEENVTEVVIRNGRYRVSLPVGHRYKVAFKNADIYQMEEGSELDLTDAPADGTVTQDLTYRMLWDSAKVFRFSIGGTAYTITPGETPKEDFQAVADGGTGSIELATADTAVVWADLDGDGRGRLTEEMISDVTDNVTYTLSENTMTFTYTDAKIAPKKYTLQVKDNSASGIARANGEKESYLFGDGSIVSKLYTGKYTISGGKQVKSADGLVTVNGKKRVSYNGTHGIMMSGTDSVSVKVAGNASVWLELCEFSAAGGKITGTVDGGGNFTSADAVDAKALKDKEKALFTYEGEAAVLTFTYEGAGSCYLHAMEVQNELPETAVTEQEEMPEAVNLTAEARGQRLYLTQKAGELQTNTQLSDSVGYYGFALTKEKNRLEADVVLEAAGNGNQKGVFFGVYDGKNIDTLGIRNHTNIRGLYSDEESVIHAGRVNEAITEGQSVHFVAERTEKGLTVTATPQGGETYQMQADESDAVFAGEDGLSFGFVLADAEVLVKNMKYYSSNGEILYDQNACYEPSGTKPEVSALQAHVADTRDAVVLTWNSRVHADGDGCYVVQVRKDGGEWELLTETKETSYRWTPDGAGTYEFRAGGRLGSEGEVTYCEKTAVIEDFLPPLAAVELTLSADADTIGARWTKTEEASGYQVYRYSADEGVELAKEVFRTDSADVTEWTDTDIEPEVPYYYYVIAFQYGSDETSVVNTSNPSRTVWAMASEGHTGDYLYEEEAAGLHITESPDGTVFDSQVSLGGSADRSGTAVVSVNGTEAARQELSNAGEEFLFDLELSQGRNEIELLFVDRNEAKTRRVYNVVWLTGYDMIVDASCKGRNETDESGRPIYVTVQEAVDAVPADNKERKVIYIRSGDYKERLTVSSPYISLVGENREHVRIHCYPAELYPADSGYEAGGDMTKRCATYITGTAVGFSAENITFANDYVYASQDGKTNKSADALRCDADGASFVNVKFRGVQDTLYMHAGNQYFYQCRIEGLIDFIYCGDEARVLFDDCDIVCIYEESHTKGGYICAPRTAAGAPYGLVFQDCAILSENGCKENSCYLARPWRQEGSVIWINCYMGAVVKKETPYADMGDARHEDARFYEYGSYGPGYTVNAERRQLSLSQIEKLRDNFGWDPKALLTETGNSYCGNTEAVEPEVPETNLPQPGTGEQNPEQSGAGKPDAGQSDAVQSGADRPERPQEEVVVTEQPAAAAGVQEARVTVEEEVIPLRKNREKIEFGDSIVEDPTRMVDDLAKEKRAGVLPWILAVIILAAGAATGGVITIRKKRK